MRLSQFAHDLQSQIEAEYAASGNGLGWRLLYSPMRVLDRARVAFVGLNPGGTILPEDHAQFAMPSGSAYVLESWVGAPSGTNPLQCQVRALFEHLDVPPADVLAGNLVPFRSPDFRRLRNRRTSLCFGEFLWTKILTRAQPEIVVTMGREVTTSINRVLNCNGVKRIDLCWGRVTGIRSQYANGLHVGLPHLSRYRVVTRKQSQAGLNELFQPFWKTL